MGVEGNSFSSPTILCILKIPQVESLQVWSAQPVTSVSSCRSPVHPLLSSLSSRALPWLEHVCRLCCPFLSKGSWPLGIPSRRLEDGEVNQAKETVLRRDNGGLYQVMVKLVGYGQILDMVKAELIGFADRICICERQEQGKVARFWPALATGRRQWH